MATESSDMATTSVDQTQLHAHKPHHKRRSDPFAEIPEPQDLLQDDGSQKSQSQTEQRVPAPLWKDIVLTPVLMTSFLVSLFIVDNQQRNWRISQHEVESPSLWSRTQFWTWADTQPYQETVTAKISSPTRPPGHHLERSQSWYLRKKKSRVAKMEIGDAFEMRGRVVLAMAAWAVLAVGVTVWSLRRLTSWAL